MRWSPLRTRWMATYANRVVDMRKKLFSEIPLIQGSRVILRRLESHDAPGLQTLVDSPSVYRYLPTFLFEKKYADVHEVIHWLYDECLKDSIILGIFMGGCFCGLGEFHGYRDPIHKISVGYRLLEAYWGMGIATEALGAMVRYLYEETDIEIITASTMVENQASANVLRKNGFTLVSSAVGEDWGYDQPTIADKWIL